MKKPDRQALRTVLLSIEIDDSQRSEWVKVLIALLKVIIINIMYFL